MHLGSKIRNKMKSITERHQHILSRLQQEGQVNVVDLCSEMQVSSVTTRKDLKLLEDKGLLFRTHGGATLHNPYTVDRPVNEKEQIQEMVIESDKWLYHCRHLLV